VARTYKREVSGYIVVVKKTFRYSNVFFYNHLCRTSLFRNIIMENGINLIDIKSQNTEQGIMNVERLGPKGALEL